MQDLGVHGQHGATLPPGELEPSEHSGKTKQDWRPPAMTTGARYQPCARQPHARVTARGAKTRNRLGRSRSGSACTLASQLRSGVLPVPETVMAHRLLSAGQGAALLVAGSVAGARVAQLLTGVAMAPVPPVGGDGYGRG